MSDAVEPTQAAPAQPTSDQQAAAQPTPEEELRFSRDAFNKRLEQASSSAVAKALKTLGFDDLKAAREYKAKADEYAKAAEEARKAEMSEIERLKADRADFEKQLAAEKAARELAAAEVEAARFEAKVSQVLAEKGITDSGYAFYLLAQAKKDGAEVDPVAIFDEALKDQRKRVALGVEKPSPSGQAAAAQTRPGASTTGGNPPPSGTPEVKKHATQMTKEEFAAERERMRSGRI